MSTLARLANAAWIASSLPSALAFRANLHRAAEVQERVLLRILRSNASTAFGCAHDFASIASVRDYQQRVPVRTYDEYVELRGDARALTASAITHHETTSGSSGAAKRIPYTHALRDEMQRAIAPWIVELAKTQPAAFAGEAYWSVSPVANADATPDEEYLGPLRAKLVRAVQAVPSSVRYLSDIDAWRRATLDHLMRCRTLSLISVWHPSFLLLLLGDLRDRASELWPQLRVISCWTDANAARDAAELARIFSNVYLQPKGLLSTEGFVSIPIGAEAPALAYRSHFYELRDVDSDRVVRATEGERGRRYRVILTTGAGLYRYDTEDVIEITGYRDACPLLRFVGRAEHVSDHYGEKLNELFVREHLDRILRKRNVDARFAMLACEEQAYALFIESDAAADIINAAARDLDEALRVNPHYDYCRRLGQLGALTAVPIRNGAATYLANAGPKLGDVKLVALDRRQGWRARFESAGNRTPAAALL